jgi:PAS domain S-box-containing protein
MFNRKIPLRIMELVIIVAGIPVIFIVGSLIHNNGWTGETSVGNKPMPDKTLMLILLYLTIALSGYFLRWGMKLTREIVQRGQTEAMSKKYLAQAKTLLASISSILIGLDEKDQVNIWNKTAEKTFEISGKEVIGELFCNCGIKWDWDIILKGISQCRRKKEPVRLDDICYSDSQGKTKLLGITLNPIGAQEDNESGILIMARDITKRKRAEEAEIERQSLKEAVKSMEQVLGVVGHELRTPLAGLRATLEFLMSADAKQLDEYDKFMKTIHSETVRMADMVNNMLEAARLNSGCAQWRWSTVRMEQTCQTALDIVSPLIDKTRVHLVCEVEPGNLEMQGDEEGIKRLLINLVTNAAKHTVEGCIKISAKEVSEEGKSSVVLKISDTGEGIPEEVARKLGEAFALNSGVVGSNYIKGTGLGLAICKGIVAAHAGSISVASDVGEGTIFTIVMRTDLAEAVKEPHNIAISQEVI